MAAITENVEFSVTLGFVTDINFLEHHILDRDRDCQYCLHLSSKPDDSQQHRHWLHSGIGFRSLIHQWNFKYLRNFKMINDLQQ